MGIAGAGFGAAKALEQILADQMVQAQLKQREMQAAQQAEMEQARLAESQRQFNVRADGDERTRRDKNNDRGLDLMKADKGEMDTENAINSLPEHLKPIAGLFRVGAMRNLSPEDVQSPEDRANALKADEERQIRIRRASQAPQQPKERKQTWVIRGGQPTPIEEGTAQPGDTPYDPVAARSSKPKDTAEAQDTAREAARLAGELLKHPGLGGAFGVFSSQMPTLRQDMADAESLRDGLTSLLTLENMEKMRGVLSDTDMKIVKQASTTLNPRMGDPAARSELKRIVEVMQRAAGDGPTAGLLPMNLATSRGTTPQAGAVDPRVQALIDKYRNPK